jgi:exosortase H (IPTLxxWG-CTERM-specific)
MGRRSRREARARGAGASQDPGRGAWGERGIVRLLSFWKNRAVLRTWVGFIVLYAVLMAVLFIWAAPLVNRQMAIFTARTTAWTLWLLGAQAQSAGTAVISPLFSFDVITECTAVFPMIIFVAAVLAYPAPWRRKLLGLAAGIPILIAINLVRLVSLFYVGYLYPKLFSTAHLVVWQSLMVFFTVLLWLFWAARSVGTHEPGPA